MPDETGFWTGTAVITGAGSGLGAAMAARFAAAGMSIAALDIDGARAAQQADELRQRGGEAIALQVDVAERASLERAAAAVQDRFGGCNVLCANVGVQQFGAIDRLTAEDWRWVLDVNVLGVVNTVASFLPLLRRRTGPRRVVLTSSSSALTPGVRMAAYIASKYAVMGYGETLRMELAPEGIGVSIFFPAGMRSRHLESSALARPAALGASVLAREDIDAMLASRKLDAAEHVVTPAHATRHLLAELRRDARFIVSHGAYRGELAARCEDLLAAFDRAQDRPEDQDQDQDQEEGRVAGIGGRDEKEAIKDLKARYFRHLDTKDWAEWRRVFTDDLQVDIDLAPAPPGGVAAKASAIAGADAFVADIRARLADSVTVHQGHMPEIALTGPDRATGIWAMEDIVEKPDGMVIHGFGHYHETYRKQDGEWRIARLRLTRLKLAITGR